MSRWILLFLFTVFSFTTANIIIGPNTTVSFGNANVAVFGGMKNQLVKNGSEIKTGTIEYLTTSRIHFEGSSQDTIENIYIFSNVTLNKPSGDLVLMNNFTVTGNVDFIQGDAYMNGNTFTLGSAGTFSNESNISYLSGVLQHTRYVGTGTSTFGGIGFQINNTGTVLGNVTINRYTGTGSEETIYGSPGIKRTWDVSMQYEGTRTVTASWLSGEDNGNILADLKVWKYESAKSLYKDDNDLIRKVRIKEKTASKRLDRDIAEEVEDDIIIDEEPKTLGWVEVDGASFNTASSPRTATYTVNSSTKYTINDTANAFADGAGTEANPYQIATLDQLNAVRYYTSACFIQVADIDASATTTWNSGSGWAPINDFTGKYNGDGHKISNLFISRSGSSYMGLFGYTSSGSEIKDMGLDNVDITGGSYTGGFVGYSRGLIKNCYSKGSVKSSTGYRSGGFAGYATTGNEIYDCYSFADVTRMDGGSSVSIAGFCGYQNTGPIYRCYSTGAVHYENTTDPTDKGFTSYSAGTVSGNFWNIETSGQTGSYGSSATGLTVDQMRTMSIFTDAAWDFQDETANGTEDVWGMNFLENNGFPFLSWEGITHDPVSGFASGIGTETDPFIISTPEHLNNVRNFLGSANSDKYWIQTNDLDLTAYQAGSGWDPIGDSSSNFYGNYDGGGNVITGLVISRFGESYNGLFGYNQGIIENIGLKDISVSGSLYTGGLLGFNYGTVRNCFATGTVLTNSYRSGGFSGYNYTSSTITDCYAKVDLHLTTGTQTDLGGFCGRNYYGTITKCYSTGSVYFDADSDPTDKGFLGTHSNGTFSDNFWDMEASNQTSTVTGSATGKTTAEMQSVATYTSTATTGLTNPWDFVGNPNDDTGAEDHWNIHTSLNDGYPYLDWENRIAVEAPANITASVSSGLLTLNWDDVSGATGYTVYSSEDPYGTFTLDETGSFNGSEWSVSVTGTRMFYFVTATNSTKEPAGNITIKKNYSINK